jgi:hypothetical protein
MTSTVESSERAEPGKASKTSTSRLRRYRTSAVIVIALAAGLIIWLVARHNGGSSKSAPVAETPAQLSQLAASAGHPIFWLGRRSGTTYEMVKSSNGSIYIRYLPTGIPVGAAGEYLTVVTYPFPGAYAAIESVSKQNGVSPISLSNGAAAETSTPVSRSTNVHIAYPGVAYQIEVFDPTPGMAARLLQQGQLAAFGKVNATPVPTFTDTTPAKLRTVAASLGHPIYWVGPKSGFKYQIAQMSNGQVQVRYIPAGQTATNSASYLTIGTYPFPKALAAMHRLAQQPTAKTISLPGGGLAVIDSQTPQSIHLAYPQSAYQIEVYDPSAAAAKRVVSTNKLKSIG